MVVVCRQRAKVLLGGICWQVRTEWDGVDRRFLDSSPYRETVSPRPTPDHPNHSPCSSQPPPLLISLLSSHVGLVEGLVIGLLIVFGAESDPRPGMELRRRRKLPGEVREATELTSREPLPRRPDPFLHPVIDYPSAD